MSRFLQCPVCAEEWGDPTYPKCAQCRRDHDDLVRKADERYSNDDIGVDPGARLSRGEEGVWVQAWVFVPHDDEE